MSARRSVTRRVSRLCRAEPPTDDERQRPKRYGQDEPEPGRKKERERRRFGSSVQACGLVPHRVRGGRRRTLAADLLSGGGRRGRRGGGGSVAAHDRRWAGSRTLHILRAR